MTTVGGAGYYIDARQYRIVCCKKINRKFLYAMIRFERSTIVFGFVNNQPREHRRQIKKINLVLRSIDFYTEATLKKLKENFHFLFQIEREIVNP